jgi:FkbM family methyltransferase
MDMQNMNDSLLDKITARENLFFKEVQDVIDKGYDLYIWGAARGANHVANKLDHAGLPYCGFVINEKFLKDNHNEHTYSLEGVLTRTQKEIGLIIAFNGFRTEMLDIYKDKIYKLIDRDCFEGNENTTIDDISYEWCVKNEGLLQHFYEELEDDFSQKTLIAYINQKISLDYKYVRPFKKSEQYFDDEILDLKDDEVLIDCGAFTGDSVDCFINALQKKGISSYDGIYSFEPDKDNFQKLIENKRDKQICLNVGCADYTGEVSFGGDGSTNSQIRDDGEQKIKIDTIDNVLSGKRASIIKMDIEGAELSALKGAEQTIKMYHPTLAICIYHKKEDLFEIPNYIKSLDSTYHFYARIYASSATEFVLYAI